MYLAGGGFGPAMGDVMMMGGGMEIPVPIMR
jgi:hypothetical protein